MKQKLPSFFREFRLFSLVDFIVRIVRIVKKKQVLCIGIEYVCNVCKFVDDEYDWHNGQSTQRNCIIY